MLLQVKRTKHYALLSWKRVPGDLGQQVKEIDEVIEEGFVPVGSPTFTPDAVIQAFYKPTVYLKHQVAFLKEVAVNNEPVPPTGWREALANLGCNVPKDAIAKSLAHLGYSAEEIEKHKKRSDELLAGVAAASQENLVDGEIEDDADDVEDNYEKHYQEKEEFMERLFRCFKKTKS